MTPTSTIAAGLMALSLAGLGAGVAHAQAQEADDAAEVQAFATVKVTPAQAITAAEADGGKVMSVEFDPGDDNEPSAYDVMVLMADGTIMDVVVNAADGTVAPSTEPDDATDQAGGGDDEDDNGTDSDGGANEDTDTGGEGADDGQEG